MNKGLSHNDSPKEARGLIRREKREKKHDRDAQLETLSMELSYKPFDIYNTDINKPIDFLVVAFHFKKVITPLEFRDILLKRLGDVFE